MAAMTFPPKLNPPAERDILGHLYRGVSRPVPVSLCRVWADRLGHLSRMSHFVPLFCFHSFADHEARP